MNSQSYLDQFRSVYTHFIRLSLSVYTYPYLIKRILKYKKKYHICNSTII